MNDAHTSTLLVYGMHCSNNEWIWCTLDGKLDVKQKRCIKQKLDEKIIMDETSFRYKLQMHWKRNYMFIANTGWKWKLVLLLEIDNYNPKAINN